MISTVAAPFCAPVSIASRRQVQMSAAAPTRQGPAAGLAGLLAAAALIASPPALAEMRLPPLDTDPNRCARAEVGNTIGQANGVSDKALDLRFCKLGGKDLRAKTLSGALMAETDFTGANMQEAVMSKAYAVGANFENADLTNAVLDRVDFNKAILKGAKLVNAVLTGCTFNDADLTGANFEDALIGNEDAKRLCLNPTLTGESRAQVGCRS